MMDIKQITRILGCGRATTINRMLKAGIKGEERPFKHGRKYYYNVTVQQLLALMTDKDQKHVTMERTKALMELETVFNRMISPDQDSMIPQVYTRGRNGTADIDHRHGIFKGKSCSRNGETVCPVLFTRYRPCC